MVDESSSSEGDRVRRALVTSDVAPESVGAEVNGVPAAGIRDPSPRNRVGSHLARTAGRRGGVGPNPEAAEPNGRGANENGSTGSSGSNGPDGERS